MIDFITAYKHYKKLPNIIAVITAILFFIWSILDCRMKLSLPSGGYAYGIFGFSSRFPVLLLWWVIGAAASVFVWYFVAVIISPTIIRTDVAAEISVYGVKICEKNEDGEPAPASSKSEESSSPCEVLCPVCKAKLSFENIQPKKGSHLGCSVCGAKFTLS